MFRVQLVVLLCLAHASAIELIGQDIDPLQMLRGTTPYLQRRASFQTTLTKRAPAPLSPQPLETPDGWFEVKYPSTDGLELKAWLHVAQKQRPVLSPAVVYFHGNFGLHDYDFKKCKPFIDAGYVVLLPTLRGENSNPGDCELFLGEVEDGMNAVQWLSRQRFVDPKKIYTFGHSAGGVISAMLSLHDNVPIRLGGSSGGLYGPTLFDHISSRVPFDMKNPVEREMRVLPGNLRWMKRPHVAYAGTEDAALRSGVLAAETELKAIKKPKLKIIHHPGNHNSALPDAMKRFVQLIGKAS